LRVSGGCRYEAEKAESDCMPAKLNHTIVAARDRDASAMFLSEILGLDPPLILGSFAVVKVGDDLTLDFVESRAGIEPQHYAFLVSEREFDQIFSRIEARRLRLLGRPAPIQKGSDQPSYSVIR
jgi:hypothetical protein